MQAVQTAGAPPNVGSTYRPRIGWIWKSRNAPRNIAKGKRAEDLWPSGVELAIRPTITPATGGRGSKLVSWQMNDFDIELQYTLKTSRPLPMPSFRRILSALLFVAAAWTWAALAQRNALPALRIAGNMTTIELAPVLVAATGVYPGSVTVINGGIPNLVRGEVD